MANITDSCALLWSAVFLSGFGTISNCPLNHITIYFFPETHVNMISSLEMVFSLLSLVILGCDGLVRDEISNFLKDQGFQNLTETFVSEKMKCGN